MDKETIQEVAMKIIGHAGDAFSSFFKAVEEARNGNFEETDKMLKQGKEQLVLAHNSQTELLTAEARGNSMEYSIFMVHAQDHLMTTIMFERIAKEFIILYKEKNQ